MKTFTILPEYAGENTIGMGNFVPAGKQQADVVQAYNQLIIIVIFPTDIQKGDVERMYGVDCHSQH